MSTAPVNQVNLLLNNTNKLDHVQNYFDLWASPHALKLAHDDFIVSIELNDKSDLVSCGAIAQNYITSI